MQLLLRTARYWLAGIRLYLAVAWAMLALEIWLWARAAFAGNPTLTLIRAEEVYAWFSLALLAVTLSIGPVHKLFPTLGGGLLMRDARRLLGIGAAWFASLHLVLVYLSESGGSGASILTTLRTTPSLLGLVALVMLLALAFTSFDKAIVGMGIWWRRLHRLIYAAGFIAWLHACMIGAHATDIWPLMLVCAAVLALIVLHICAALRRPGTPRWYWLGIAVTMLALLVVANYGVQQYTKRVSIILEHNH